MSKKGGGDCMCLCGLKLEVPKQECPEHLKNWELWMKRRKKMNQLLSKKLERAPGDLVMNIGEEYRNAKEDKLVLSYTKVNTYFDKWRGNPIFWTLPNSLKSREPPYKSSEYFLARTKEEKGEIPAIEYVGVPDLILQEKDILPRTRNLYTLWRTNNSYREQVVQKVSSKLAEIEPHRPDLRDLIIIGKQIGSADEDELAPASQLTNQPSKSLFVEEVAEAEEDRPRNSFKINNTHFTDQISVPYNQSRISVSFECYTDCCTPSEQVLVLANTGQTVLRLYWKPYYKLRLFREYIEANDIFYPFKFNRNEIPLLPGEKKEFYIWFQAKKVGNYFEYWEIVTLPKIVSQEHKILIVLKGFAYLRDYEQKARNILQSISQRARSTVVKDLIGEIILRGNYCTPSRTACVDFTEKELFESANLKDNLQGLIPKYVYEKSLVNQLKEIYLEVKEEGDPAKWNFSINGLKEACRKKDLYLYFQGKMDTYETVKKYKLSGQNNVGEEQIQVERKSEKASGSKPTSRQRKESVVAEENPAIPTEPTFYYNKLEDVLERLEKPCVIPYNERLKYFYCYTVFKTYFLKMFDLLDLLTTLREPNTKFFDKIDEEITSESSKETPKQQQVFYTQTEPNRLIFELYDEAYIWRTKRVTQEYGVALAKPKSFLLRGISNTDVRKIYKAYFHKEDPGEKGQKKKEKKADEKASKKTSSKKEGASKKSGREGSKELDSNYVKDNFDPFALDLVVQPEYHAPSDTFASSSTYLSSNEIENYNDKYLTVYTLLSDAVDALVDVIESSRDHNVLPGTLGDLQKCNLLSDEETRSTESSVANNTIDLHSSPSNEEYFKFLMQTHLENNLETRKYFIDEQTTCAKGVDECVSSVASVTLANLFSMEEYTRKPEPRGIRNTGVQTSLGEIIIKDKISEIKEKRSMESSHSLERTSSRNIFYFLEHTCKGDSGSSIEE